jgi:hypothetical protein
MTSFASLAAKALNNKRLKEYEKQLAIVQPNICIEDDEREISDFAEFGAYTRQQVCKNGQWEDKKYEASSAIAVMGGKRRRKHKTKRRHISKRNFSKKTRIRQKK